MFVGGIVTYFTWYKPKVQTVKENIKARSTMINEANFFFWDVANNISMEYINASHYDFVILKPDKITAMSADTIQKNIIVDYTEAKDLKTFKNDEKLNKRYGVIGMLLPVSEANKQITQLKSTCMLWGCTINYITQFFLLWDEEPNKELANTIKKHPQNFSILTQNYFTESKSIETPTDIRIFTVETLSGIPDIENVDLWNKIGSIVEKSDKNKFGYQLVFGNDNTYPILSQVPKATIEYVEDTVPFFKWNIVAPHKGVSQQSYSMTLASKSTDWQEYYNQFPIEVNLTADPFIFMYTTGRTPSSMTQAELIPEKEVVGTEFSLLLQAWTFVSFEGYKSFETIPVFPTTISFDFDFNQFQKGSKRSDFKSIAWIPEWGMTEGLTTLTNNPKLYTSVSPVWFWPSADGTLRTLQSFNNQELITFCRNNGITIIPSIQIENDDVEVVSSILNESVDQHIDSIVNVVVQNGYDGIDLDYEITYLKDKDALISFLTNLRDRLHEHGKILSFTVLPQWGDNITYGYRPETHVAQDWKQIGEIVDEFRIMSYDYRTRGNAIPGPIAPQSWYLAILRYAQANVSNEK